MHRIDAHLLPVTAPARVQVAAVFLLELRIGVEAADIVPQAGFHVVDEEDALVGRRIRVGVAQQPAHVHRREGHMAVFREHALGDGFVSEGVVVGIEVVLDAVSAVRAPDDDLVF